MNIAIAGFGLEGRVSYTYWNTPENTVTIVDQRSELADLPNGAKALLGEDAFNKLDGFDLVVRTASLRPDKIKTNGRIWSATNEFFSKCPAKIIGVTGTKGKGTTSSLIASILSAGGKTVHLVGNIGTPALEVLPQIARDDLVVFELSSFQLWDIEKSPHTAVILKIEKDHQDIHAGMQEYVEAKANITRFMQPDENIFYHPTFPYSKQAATLYHTGRAIPYAVKSAEAAYIENDTFMVGNTEICSTDVMQIPGDHNKENACAAISAAYEYVSDKQAIEKGLRTFTGLPHRLKFVRNISGVSYYDDSYSSAPAAAVAAIRSFMEPEVVILGGYDKGSEFNELAEEIALRTNIRKLILIGQTKHKIATALTQAGVNEEEYEVVQSTDFEEIVHIAAGFARSGDVVILSPACASFDMFKNFTERGEQFVGIVESL